MFAARNFHHTALFKWRNRKQDGLPLALFGVLPELPFLDPIIELLFPVKSLMRLSNIGMMTVWKLIRGIEIVAFSEDFCNVRKGSTLFDVQSLNQRPELLPLLPR